MTRIAVAMCTYNGAAHLERQLRSIAAQGRLPDELVVCDDCSTDATPELLRRFAAEARFEVRLQLNTKNLGVTPNFQQALTSCRGDLLVLADQDDEWLPGKLEACERALAAHPEWGMLFSDAEVMNEHDQALGFGLWDALGFDARAQARFAEGEAFAVLERRNVVTGAVSVLRQSLLSLCLPLSPLWVHDAWIAAVASVVSEIGPIPERLVRYRRHSRQQVGVRVPRQATLSAGQRVRRWLSSRDDELTLTAAKLADLVSHLEGIDATSRSARALGAYRDRQQHIERRLSLPQGLLRRLAVVGEELVSRRYDRFSSGPGSALKDLVLPPGRSHAQAHD